MASHKVVVIDDSAVIRHMVRDMLPQGNFEILEAKDGIQGITLIRQEHPTLIMLDFLLPRMSGWEVFQEILKQPELHNIPLVLMSGRKEEVTEKLTEPFDYFEFVQKPFDHKALVEAIKGAMAKAQRRVKMSPAAVSTVPVAGATVNEEIPALHAKIAALQDELNSLKRQMTDWMGIMEQKIAAVSYPPTPQPEPSQPEPYLPISAQATSVQPISAQSTGELSREQPEPKQSVSHSAESYPTEAYPSAPYPAEFEPVETRPELYQADFHQEAYQPVEAYQEPPQAEVYQQVDFNPFQASPSDVHSPQSAPAAFVQAGQPSSMASPFELDSCDTPSEIFARSGFAVHSALTDPIADDPIADEFSPFFGVSRSELPSTPAMHQIWPPTPDSLPLQRDITPTAPEDRMPMLEASLFLDS